MIAPSGRAYAPRRSLFAVFAVLAVFAERPLPYHLTWHPPHHEIAFADLADFAVLAETAPLGITLAELLETAFMEL